MKEYDGEGSTDLPQGVNIEIPGNHCDHNRTRGRMRKRIEKAWIRWRELTGVLCNQKIPTKFNFLLYKTAMPAA